MSSISIHALLAESDVGASEGATSGDYFYPRSPCGERQENPTQKREAKTFLSTLSLRRATHAPNHNPCSRSISIHALLAESDGVDSCSVCSSKIISIHALLAESDPFLSHLSMAPVCISIHALLAESDQTQRLKIAPHGISIHALLAESDKSLWIRRK